MQKLIKLSETHYIVVDDSEIKENQWYCNNKVLFLSNSKFDEGNNPNQNKNNKLVTHSTQPLNCNCAINNRSLDLNCAERNHCFDKIKPLSLSEVEELVLGYSVQKLSYEKYNDGSISTNTRNDWRECWKEGFKAHQKLVKDKLFTIENVINFYNWLKKSYSSIKPLEEAQIVHRTTPDKIAEMYLQTLQKSEWQITFDEQGKIKLV